MPSLETVGAFACPTIRVGTASACPWLVAVDVGVPQTCTTAGPPVMNSLLPSIFAGIGGAVRFWRAAVCFVESALNVNVAADLLMTPYRGSPVTLEGSVVGAWTAKPASAEAWPRDWTSFGCGGTVHSNVPYAPMHSCRFRPAQAWPR